MICALEMQVRSSLPLAADVAGLERRRRLVADEVCHLEQRKREFQQDLSALQGLSGRRPAGPAHVADAIAAAMGGRNIMEPRMEPRSAGAVHAEVVQVGAMVQSDMDRFVAEQLAASAAGSNAAPLRTALSVSSSQGTVPEDRPRSARSSVNAALPARPGPPGYMLHHVGVPGTLLKVRGSPATEFRQLRVRAPEVPFVPSFAPGPGLLQAAEPLAMSSPRTYAAYPGLPFIAAPGPCFSRSLAATPQSRFRAESPPMSPLPQQPYRQQPAPVYSQ